MLSESPLRYHSAINKRRFLQITKALVDSMRFDILERIAATREKISCIDLRAEIPVYASSWPVGSYTVAKESSGPRDFRGDSEGLFATTRR